MEEVRREFQAEEKHVQKSRGKRVVGTFKELRSKSDWDTVQGRER
jgi:hypothetical protein